jgi:hypothetical protein
MVFLEDSRDLLYDDAHPGILYLDAQPIAMTAAAEQNFAFGCIADRV